MGPGLTVTELIRDQHGPQRWEGLAVTVAGLGIAGFACADALLDRGAAVTVLDAADSDALRERAGVLELLGADVRLGPRARDLPASTGLLVVSPGLPPAAPVISAALASGTEVWGELELAWQLRDPDAAADWLFVSGTNGKTTTTLMLAAMLAAGGLRTEAVGNIGVSLVAAITSGVAYDALAIEVGAPQLPFLYSARPLAAACLNLAPDHVDHFGSFDAYQAAKSRVYQGTALACVYNVDDPATERMVEAAEVVDGCRAIGFTLGVPAPSMLGVVDDMLVDRAFIEHRQTEAQELASVADVHPAAPHNIANALAAASLARARGISALAVREGLRRYRPAGHRIADVARVAGVRYVDDSKATNGHAAAMSLRAYDQVVWIAGGLAKGQRFDDLVAGAAGRLRAVVVLGADRGLLRDALARHAPQVPVVEVSRTDTGAMAEVVRAAAGLARPGDTVLLAPGCASWDMFRDYAQRGERFAEAVRSLPGAAS